MRLKVLKGFAKKEFIQIFADKKMIGALLFVPIIQTIIFGIALSNEVKHIKFAVISKPQDVIASKIRKKTDASKWFDNASTIASTNFVNITNYIMSGKVEAILVAPLEGFKKGFEKRKPFQLLIDAKNAQRARQIEFYVNAVLQETIKESFPQFSNINLIKIIPRILYNHTLDTAPFMIPAIAIMATFISVMLVCCMSITKEKEEGTIEKLISSPITVSEIIIGKTLPYALIGIFIICLVVLAGNVFLNIPFRGHFYQVLITGTFFIFTSLSIALLISTIAQNQQQAMMGCFIVLFPSILMSGIMFPIENIPTAIRWVCYLNPVTYGATNMRNIMLKGGDLQIFWQYCFALFMLACLIATFSIKKFKSILN
ncbi:MAG: ABC transporter permease [Endomicrobium sp.]|jgi:ABC-2 type transport system permease protein|nr:ABC transporter permease [Endomicrobium sp.]